MKIFGFDFYIGDSEEVCCECGCQSDAGRWLIFDRFKGLICNICLLTKSNKKI